MVRKSLDYQGIARRALGEKVEYNTDIDTGPSVKKKRRFNVIDRAVQKARLEIQEENMSFRPLHDHVILTRVKADSVSKGGIYIPPTAQEKTTEGVVVAAGNGVHLENGTIRPLDVKKGDRVLFDKYAGSEIKLNGEEYIVLREANIICVLD